MNFPSEIEIKVMQLATELPLPRYAQPGDAGADLFATETVTLRPGERGLVGTGICLEIPLGYVGLIHPRSGLALKHGLTVLNTPGTIDAGYRGEIKVLLINLDPSAAVTINRGDRIAQLVLQQVCKATFLPVTELGKSERGSGGYGSTGIRNESDV